LPRPTSTDVDLVLAKEVDAGDVVAGPVDHVADADDRVDAGGVPGGDGLGQQLDLGVDVADQ